MKPITLYKPSSIAEATQILAHHGPEAAIYAGGTDLLIRLKNRLNAAPKYLVDIKGIDELKFIRATPDGGLAIGATMPIAEVQDSEIREGLRFEGALRRDLVLQERQLAAQEGEHVGGAVSIRLEAALLVVPDE